MRLFRRVSELLTVWDPMGIGDPRPRADEYDIEAAQITRLVLEPGGDREALERHVRGVFDAYFWPGGAAHLDAVAEQVWEAWRDVQARRGRKDLSRRALGADAVAYVVDRLWLAAGFADALTARLQEGAWRAWTLADSDASDERLARFSTGGHVFSGSAAYQIGNVVASRLRRSAGCWIVPDLMAKPSDPFLARTPHVTVDDGVYYVEAAAERTVVAGTWVQAASAAGAIGVVARRCFASPDDRSESFGRIVETLELLVVEAYDGDGVIYVEPDR